MPEPTPKSRPAPKSKHDLEAKRQIRAAAKAAAANPPPAPAQPVIDPRADAMGWLHTAKFLTTAAQLHHLPDHDLPEIAFVGRSNAGKSTCINALAQQKRLAFASKTPGRTQHVNLFTVGKGGEPDAALADLPGYGYAAVPKDAKYRWQQVMANYLVSRPQLIGVVVLCDSRHGITEIDESLLELLRPRVEEGLPFVVALTKSDKLTRAEGTKAVSIAKLQSGGGSVQLISAQSKTGMAELALTLRQWVEADMPARAQAAQARAAATAEAAALEAAQVVADGSLQKE